MNARRPVDLRPRQPLGSLEAAIASAIRPVLDKLTDLEAEIRQLHGEPKAYDARQVAEALGVSERFVRQQWSTGAWPSFAAGVNKRMSLQQLRRVMGDAGEDE